MISHQAKLEIGTGFHFITIVPYVFLISGLIGKFNFYTGAVNLTKTKASKIAVVTL